MQTKLTRTKDDGTDVKLDEGTLTILQILRLNDGSATTGEIRENHGSLDKNQQIQYRLTEKLVPTGLVEKTNEPHPKYPQGINTWTLTDEGHAFLESHSGVLKDVVSNREAVEKMDHMEDVITRFRDRLEDAEESAEHAEKRAEDANSNVSSFRHDIREDVKAQLEQYKNRASAAEERAEEAEKRAEELEADVSELEAQNEYLWEELESLKRRLSEAE